VPTSALKMGAGQNGIIKQNPKSEISLAWTPHIC